MAAAAGGHRDASGANDTVSNRDLVRGADTGPFEDFYQRFMFASVADGLAERFGTKGSPISLSTACASGASAIQLGIEAIRRGEARGGAVHRHRRLDQSRIAGPLLAAVGAVDRRTIRRRRPPSRSPRTATAS